jgi:DNA repair protein RadC
VCVCVCVNVCMFMHTCMHASSHAREYVYKNVHYSVLNVLCIHLHMQSNLCESGHTKVLYREVPTGGALDERGSTCSGSKHDHAILVTD